MVLPGFSEASGTSTRNRPHEPTASKPVVPRGHLYAPIVVATAKRRKGRRTDGELRRGGGRRRARGRGGGRPAGRGRARGRPGRGRPRRRRVLLLRLHALQGAAAPGRGPARGAAHPRRAGGPDG